MDGRVPATGRLADGDGQPGARDPDRPAEARARGFPGAAPVGAGQQVRQHECADPGRGGLAAASRALDSVARLSSGTSST